MNRTGPTAFILALLMFPALVAPGSANLIAYNVGTPNHNRVMVMDDTGANAAQIYEGGKFSGALRLTVSPPGVDGTWVAFEDYNLYKVRTDGTDLTKMLCFQGTYSNGELFNLFGDPQWSPDGSEILVSVLGEQGLELALLPADSEVYSDATGEDCASLELVLIPYFGETRDDEWGLEGTAAWNDDGSQIAFFEFSGPWVEGGNSRLAILERQESGDWVLQQPSFHPDFAGIYPFALDWQRGGNVLAFVVRVGAEARSDFWLTWIDVENGNWGFFTDNGGPIEVTWDPTWSPESPSQHLIFTDSRGNLVKWTYPNGPGEVLGSGKGADWQRDALDLTCESNDECDDGNPCTDDSCVDSTCQHDDVANGSTPLECSGECWGGTCTVAECANDTECVDDGDSCTVAICVDASSPWAYCDFETKNCGFDDGCCPPGCDFLNDGDGDCPSCLPKGDTCSTNAECCSGSCHPRKGTCK